MFCPNPECPDFVETGKPGEYTHGVAVCPVCESYLEERFPVEDPGDSASGSPSFDSRPPSPDEEFEPVFECTDPSEIQLIKSFLESEGIRYLITGEERYDAFRGSLSAFRLNPKAGVVHFLVPAVVAERTRGLLMAFEEPCVAADDESWAGADPDESG